jgi:hypothetical protein
VLCTITFPLLQSWRDQLGCVLKAVPTLHPVALLNSRQHIHFSSLHIRTTYSPRDDHGTFLDYHCGPSNRRFRA